MPAIDLNARAKPDKAILIALIAMTHAQQMDLLAIYNRIVMLWAEAVPRIVAAYAVSLNEEPLSSNGPADAAREIDATAAAASTLMILLPAALTQWASRIEKVHQAKWVRAVLSATKVDISTVIGPSDMNALLKASVDWNAALVRDVSNEIQRKIANAVFNGFQTRASIYDVAKEIAKTTGIARGRARNIAKDQTSKLGAALNKARMQQAGITHFQWIHGATLHARKWHLARNYKVFPWEGPGSIDPSDMPAIPPFCSCTARAVILPSDSGVGYTKRAETVR